MSENKNIDVFIWQGTSFLESKLAIYGNTWNAPAVPGKVYSVDISKGIFIVTIPKKYEREMNLAFSYWVDYNYSGASIISASVFIAVA